MQNHSDKWTRYASSGNFRMDTRAVINNVEYSTITAPVITNGLLPGKDLSVGNCISGTCTFTVMTNDMIPRSGEVVIKGRIIDEQNYIKWQNGLIPESEAFSEWLEFGHFWVDKRTIEEGPDEKLTSLECFDAMLKGNQPYDDDTPTASWPRPMQTVVNRIAYLMGVQVDPRTVIETGSDYVITKPGNDTTLLDLLRIIGEVHAGNWTITPANKLRLVPLISAPDETFYIMDENYRRIKTPEGDNLVWLTSEQMVMPYGIGYINVPVVLGNIEISDSYTISRVTMTIGENGEYTAGDDTGHELKIEKNPCASQAMCNRLYTALNGLVYSPYNMTGAVYDPTVELGDMVFAGSIVHSILYTAKQTFDVTYRVDAAAPSEIEYGSEYPYITMTEKTDAIAKSVHTVSSNAVARSQTIYKSFASAAVVVPKNETWVTDDTGGQNGWTNVRPEYNASYPVLYVASQQQTVEQYGDGTGTACDCTTPAMDTTTTVIDGGHITTGYISANRISGGTIDGNTVNAKQFQVIDGDDNVVATFDSVITIGNTADVHAEMDYNSFKIKDASGAMFAVMGDIRNADGYFEYTDTETVDSSSWYGFTLTYPVLSRDDVVGVTKNGIETSYFNIIQYSTPYPSTLFSTSPVSVGDVITVKYRSTSPICRYDFGTRNNSEIIGYGSIIEGYNTAALGPYSHAEGLDTKAQYYGDHAEGYGTKAMGICSHAEGRNTTASGNYSHAEGESTTASGFISHAEGSSTTASGSYSHAEGDGTIANKSCQHVFGRYNVADPAPSGQATHIEIVGNGSGNSRLNIRTLDYNGNEWINGTLTQASDQRLKTECDDVPDVSGIKARAFRWNEKKQCHDEKIHLGYFAQDVEKVAPYLVDEDAMGYKSLDYNGILVAKIASLERRVAELEQKLANR